MMATIIAGIPEFERELIQGADPLRYRRRKSAASALGGSRGSGRNPIGSLQKCLHLSLREGAIA